MLRDEIRQQRQGLKGKGVKAHISWFITYYKWYVAAAVALIFVMYTLLSAVLAPRIPTLNVLFLNISGYSEELDDRITEDLTSCLTAAAEAAGDASSDAGSGQVTEAAADGADGDGRGSDNAASDASAAGVDATAVEVDLTTTLTPGDDQGMYDAYTIQKLAAMSAAGSLDVLIFDQWWFDNLAGSGMMLDLREVMSEEEIASYGDRVYYMDQAGLEEYLEDEDGGSSADAGQEEAKSPEEDGSEWDADGSDGSGTVSSGREAAQETEAYVSEEEARASESKEQFVMPDPDTMTDPVPAGIVLTDSPYIEELGIYPDTVAIFGFAAAGSHTQAARAVLAYLFDM